MSRVASSVGPLTPPSPSSFVESLPNKRLKRDHNLLEQHPRTILPWPPLPNFSNKQIENYRQIQTPSPDSNANLVLPTIIPPKANKNDSSSGLEVKKEKTQIFIKINSSILETPNF